MNQRHHQESQSATTLVFRDIDACVDALLSELSDDIAVGAPLGLGKANAILNALYARIADDQSRSMTIMTALSLAPPQPKGDLETRLAAPILARLYGETTPLTYVEPRRRGQLPENIAIRSFFLPTGQYKGAADAQMEYISSNYTHAARDIAERGLDVIVQQVSAPVEREDGIYYSLGSNPDLTMELMDRLAAKGSEPLLVGQVNRAMPAMGGEAWVPASRFAMILDHPRYDAPLFPLPAPAVDARAHAIGLYASALIPDGGTLQVGIGSLGDALIHALLLRQDHNHRYQELLRDLNDQATDSGVGIGGVTPFRKGLYANSEMFVHGFVQLLERGVLKRRVYEHPTLQRWANEHGRNGRVPVGPALLKQLCDDGTITAQLTADDVARLQAWGVLSPFWRWRPAAHNASGVDSPPLLWAPLPSGTSHDHGGRGDHLVQREASGVAIEATLSAILQAHKEATEQIEETTSSSDLPAHAFPPVLGDALRGGTALHAGFFLGTEAMYDALQKMPSAQRDAIAMASITRINSLQQDPTLLSLQRQKLRCVNIAMSCTLTGAVASDGLDDGQVISGVGGQYDFVSMAHQLPEARSIILLPSVGFRDGRWRSNIVWQYGHTTIPRHLRDIVITEYGVAMLRGKTDRECIEAMLAITDSRFQDELCQQAKDAGKLPQEYVIPLRYRKNTPWHLEAHFRPQQRQGWLPLYPLGTSLHEEEIVLSQALQRLRQTTVTWRGRWKLLKALPSLLGDPSPMAERCLQRMGLDDPQSLKERGLRLLVQVAVERYLERQGYLHALPLSERQSFS